MAHLGESHDQEPEHTATEPASNSMMHKTDHGLDLIFN